MNKKLQSALVASTIAITSVSYAVPNTFTSGQPARASEVNANFTDLEQQININSQDIQTNIQDIDANATAIQANTDAINAGQATTYDFHDFATDPTIVRKTYDAVGICPGTATDDTEARDITRNVTAQGTEITVTRTRQSSASGICHIRSFNYLSTETQRLLLSSDEYQNDNTYIESRLLDQPILTATSTMGEGKMIGSGAKVSTQLAGSQDTTFDGVIVNATTVVGVEDVTVPAGRFNGCLKVITSRTSPNFGSFDRISWHCPGLGEVKRMHGGTTRVWELRSVTYAAP